MAKLEVLLDNTWMVICNLARASLARVDASSSHLPLTCHCICWWKWIGWRWWFDLSSLYLCLSPTFPRGKILWRWLIVCQLRTFDCWWLAFIPPIWKPAASGCCDDKDICHVPNFSVLPCSLVASLGLSTVHKPAIRSTRQNLDKRCWLYQSVWNIGQSAK